MTGLIYVVIIALWVAVLVPIWLKRHDQVSEVRSTARFHHAMQSLAGHPDAHAPSRTATLTRRYAPAERDMARTPYASLTPAQQSMAKRRAIILGSLTALLAITLILAIVSVAPKWLPIIFAALVAAFIIASAMTASQRAQSATARERIARPRRDLHEEMQDVLAATAPAEDDWETWNAWDDEDGWEAVPQTLPTYVNAPRASAIPRPIDRSRPGEWTGEAMVETARSMRRHRPTFEDVDAKASTAEIPVVRPERRVVNE